MKKILFIVLVASLMSSCKKFADAPTLNFDVTLAKTTYKVGEQVNFQITGGDAHQISFYSGKTGNAYDFRNTKRIDQIKELYLGFETHNTRTANEADVKLLVSTDFNGTYDYTNITKANWVEMTDRFVFGAPAAWQVGWTSSGVQNNFYDLVQGAKSFYIAYKYNTQDKPVGTVPAADWRSRNHVLRGVTQYGTSSSLATNAAASWGWTLVKKDPLMTSGSIISGTIMLLVKPNSVSPYYRQAYEEWGVSKKFQISDIELGVDYSTAIKQYVDPPISSYATTYTAAGTYKVTFVANNATAENSNQVIKEMQITITP